MLHYFELKIVLSFVMMWIILLEIFPNSMQNLFYVGCLHTKKGKSINLLWVQYIILMHHFSQQHGKWIWTFSTLIIFPNLFLPMCYCCFHIDNLCRLSCQYVWRSLYNLHRFCSNENLLFNVRAVQEICRILL